MLLGVPAAAVAQDTADDPRLDQKIAAEQPVAGGRKVLADGHVDVGPRFLDGRWTLMIHDDEAKADDAGKSVWRHAGRTVLRVADDAVLSVPDDPDYAFLPARPGDEVHVIPQTQDPDVVWLGWNTQDPAVIETIDRGVTMTLVDVQGPGELVVYLQSGDFGKPKRLWDSTGRPNPIWVDVDTHTHANWVFTRPGVYLAQIRISAELVDGTKVSDTRPLRFAVGSRTPVADALAARWAGAPPTEGEEAGDAPPANVAEEGGGAAGLVAAIGLLAVGLIAGTTTVILRGRRVKRRARASRPPVADAAGPSGSDEAA